MLGSDGGSDCLKKQMSKNKLIRPPSDTEVVSLFVKQYPGIKAKKKQQPPSCFEAGRRQTEAPMRDR